MRLLVCGGRDFGDVQSLPVNLPGDDPERLHVEGEFNFGFKWLENEILCKWLGENDTLTVITGGATGADYIGWIFGEQYADENLQFPADWDDFSPPCKTKYTKTGKPYNALAGFKRNQRMIDEGKPDLVIAFPGDKGTADMVDRAYKSGIEVIQVKYPNWDFSTEDA